MTDDVADFWDGQAANFDDEPDHGLRDADVRAAWKRLLLPELPAAPASVVTAAIDAHFLVADAAAPGLEHGAFDVVLARHVLWAMSEIDAAIAEWVALLRPSGRLVLVEGQWHTGAGLTASDTAQAVRRHRDEARVSSLDDADLWGGPITDERYLVVSRS